jgi:Skp family chaperone for outer membrane proteins
MKWLPAAAILLAGAVLTASAYDQRIVFVDMNILFEKYHKTERADAQLQEQAETLNVEYEQMLEDLEALRESFNKLRDEAQDMALSKETRERKKANAEDKLLEISQEEQRLQRFRETRSKQLNNQQRRMRDQIVREIREIMETYAKQQGYSAILDLSGESMNGVEIILYSDGSQDITDEVLEELNKGRLEDDAEEEE